ncbi:MAG: hypothetical protein WC840_01775 [Candidatus Peribacteraceae bacterium]
MRLSRRKKRANQGKNFLLHRHTAEFISGGDSYQVIKEGKDVYFKFVDDGWKWSSDYGVKWIDAKGEVRKEDVGGSEKAAKEFNAIRQDLMAL